MNPVIIRFSFRGADYRLVISPQTFHVISEQKHVDAAGGESWRPCQLDGLGRMTPLARAYLLVAGDLPHNLGEITEVVPPTNKTPPAHAPRPPTPPVGLSR